MFPPDTNFLVVDDSEGVRALIKSQLNTLGFKNIFEAENGKVALDKIELLGGAGHPVNVVISDWNMPEMSGIELLTAFRKLPAHGATPFLMITAQNDLKNVVNAISSGVSDYLVKPFTEELLSQKLTNVWKKHYGK